MNRPERLFLRVLQCFSLLLLLTAALAGLMLFSCQSAQAAENESRVPGVLEYARKYGEEKKRAESAQGGSKKTEQQPRAIRKQSVNAVPAESELRRRLRQQEVMLEQVRRENRQLRQQREKQTEVTAGEDGQKTEQLQKQVVALSAELKQLQVSQESAVEE
ncbi:hypothetical protein S451_17065 [Salmonella enterica subsp. enterica]|nr:hypothetical protein [Salmonella enterica subsp. enterica]ECJ7251600.1 hypothetical protein [Salmonella enterica subsp. enterica]